MINKGKIALTVISPLNNRYGTVKYRREGKGKEGKGRNKTKGLCYAAFAVILVLTIFVLNVQADTVDFYFTVSAVDTSGNESSYSNEVVTSVNEGEAKILEWQAPTTNEDGSPLTDLAGYKFYYGTSSRVYGAPLTTTATFLEVTVNPILAPASPVSLQERP